MIIRIDIHQLPGGLWQAEAWKVTDDEGCILEENIDVGIGFSPAGAIQQMSDFLAFSNDNRTIFPNPK